jgi:hypothetical protein
MPTPVEVSHVKRSRVNRSGIEGLGGTFRGQPWYLSERKVIAEIEQPDDSRAWNFYITADGLQVPIVIVSKDGRKYLTVKGRPHALLELSEQPEQVLGWEVY